MSKQTAVEWLIEQIRLTPDENFNAITISKMKMEAKKMEREQIIDAALELICNEYELEVATQDLINSAKQYYRETYKGGEQ